MIWSSLYVKIGKHKLLFATSLFVMVIHLITLPISPMPWFDEVFFASITKEFARTGEFTLGMSPYINREILLYGPVYFILTGLSYKFLGLTALGFRMVNFMAAMASIGMVFKLSRTHFSIDAKSAWILSLVLLLDPTMHSSMHSGRMDFVALFFALLGMHYLLASKSRSRTDMNPYILTMLSAVFSTLAFLTTPRIVVLIVPIAFILLLRFLKEKSLSRFFEGALWAALFITGYLCWLYYAFGGIEQYFSYYEGFSQFLGASYRPPLMAWPIIISAITTLGLVLYFNPIADILKKEMVLVIFISIVLFHSLVSLNSTHYLGIILPYYALLIAYGISSLDSFKAQKYPSMLSKLLVSAFLMFFLFKAAVLWEGYQARNPHQLSRFLERNLKPNNIVMGDYQYFYGIEQQKGTFLSYQYTSPFNSFDDVSRYLENHQEVKYLLFSAQNLTTDPVKQLLLTDRWVEVNSLRTPAPKDGLSKYLPSGISMSYDGTLFERE